MKTSHYRVVPLPTEVAEEARRNALAGASDHAFVEVDSSTGYPCRHCLRWVRPGERVVLFPYASVSPGRPYSESGPIFVHEKACQRYPASGEYPEHFRNHRVLRAYDGDENMIDAVVVPDDQPEPVIARLLQNPDTAFLQARSVTRGCYTFRIERA
ncbi:MAG: DUF1203 domain-containing protein [Chthoniobacterales bacterium]